jgi:hypothetical protein
MDDQIPETYTIRPEGCTAWADRVSRRDVLDEYERAVDVGLTRVLIVRDSDGEAVPPETFMD